MDCVDDNGLDRIKVNFSITGFLISNLTWQICVFQNNILFHPTAKTLMKQWEIHLYLDCVMVIVSHLSCFATSTFDNSFSKTHMKRWDFIVMSLIAIQKIGLYYISPSLPLPSLWIYFTKYLQQSTKKNKVQSVKVRWWTVVYLHDEFILMRCGARVGGPKTLNLWHLLK